MERIKHLPNEESAEEIGERIIQELLHSPSPPQTLEEDLLETLARITHRTIAELQREFQRKRYAICRDVVAQTETYLREHPKITKEERGSKKEAATHFARNQVEAHREAASLTIVAMLCEEKRRAAAIRTFCQNHDPNNGTNTKDIPDSPVFCPEKHSIAPAA